MTPVERRKDTLAFWIAIALLLGALYGLTTNIYVAFETPRDPCTHLTGVARWRCAHGDG